MHTHSCCLLSLIICSFPLKTSWTYGPLKPAVSPPCTHSLPILSVGQQVYWILMISAADSLWLISGCRFSVVYSIRFSCLHPSIISPHSAAFVRNEGGHLPSVPPLSFIPLQPDLRGVERPALEVEDSVCILCSHVCPSRHCVFGPNPQTEIPVGFAQRVRVVFFFIAKVSGSILNYIQLRRFCLEINLFKKCIFYARYANCYKLIKMNR